MNFIKSALLVFTAFCVFSCKKNKDPEIKPEPRPVTYPDFSQLKVGNYWVYQWFDVDENGKDSATLDFDSSYVEKDTIIRNNKYFKIRTVGDIALVPVSFLRDSLHYLINQNGNILFSSEDFNRIFYTYYPEGLPGDTICRVDLQTEEAKTQFQVPAGNLTTRNTKYTYSFYPKYTYGRNPRFTYNRYAENIGLVSEGMLWGVMDQGYSEKRLIRYKVN
ncbi:MAG: hypothetical protein ACXWDO_01555 [Bacteroidia bacterium]